MLAAPQGDTLALPASTRGLQELPWQTLTRAPTPDIQSRTVIASLEDVHELAPPEDNVPRKSVYHRVGGACKLVMTRDIAVEALVDANHAQ